MKTMETSLVFCGRSKFGNGFTIQAIVVTFVSQSDDSTSQPTKHMPFII